MLETDIGIKLKNPTILASGILGTSLSLLKRVEQAGAGAATTKSIGLKKREGNENPVIFDLGFGLLNAMGLPNPGIKEAAEEFSQGLSIPLIVSIYAKSPKDFASIAIKCDFADAIELNASCPNVKGQIIGKDKKAVYEIVKTVRKSTEKPLILKLGLCDKIAEIARKCERYVNAINAINTIPGMVIDTETQMPALSFKSGGLSGPAIRPLALNCVYEIYEHIKIPIIGTGGIVSPKDAIERILAGASAVGIGSGIMYNDLKIFRQICDGIRKYMARKKIKSIKELVGRAHDC